MFMLEGWLTFVNAKKEPLIEEKQTYAHLHLFDQESKQVSLVYKVIASKIKRTAGRAKCPEDVYYPGTVVSI